MNRCSRPAGVRVSVPATTANLGAGFDVLGMALQLYLTLQVRPAGAGRAEVSFPDSDHLGTGSVDGAAVREAMVAGLRLSDCRDAGYRAEVRSDIPPARGLGSSAALRVACLLAACELWGRQERDGLVEAAARLEGHADNAIAALKGGLIVAAPNGDAYCWTKLNVPDSLVAVTAIPELTVETKASRDGLPDSVRRADAVFNMARTALFVAAIAHSRFELLGTAMEDRLHQQRRLALTPGAAEALASARGAGALGAALSGSGPAVLALCDRRDEAEDAVSQALAEAFRARGTPVQLLRLAPDNQGARIKPLA